MSVDSPEPPAEDLDWPRVLRWLPWSADHADPTRHGAAATEAETGLGDLVRDLYDVQVVTDFDWPSWRAERGDDLRRAPEAMATASLEECRMLLAAHVRADRFSEGHLSGAVEDGHVRAVLERIGDLRGRERP